MTDTPGGLASLRGHPDFAAAAPTPDHFLPLLYLAGLAEAAGHGAEVLVEGYAMGSLSMTSYVLDPAMAGAGGAEAGRDESGGPAPILPDPSIVPPDDTNV
jgi:4,5-DOPA dioxygenase extradiol